YRDAVVQVQTRIEGALRGDTIPDPQGGASPLQAQRAVIGQAVPDFICTDLLTRNPVQLQRVLGKPIVVLFYDPATENGHQVLRFGLALTQRFPREVTIMPMAITD